VEIRSESAPNSVGSATSVVGKTCPRLSHRRSGQKENRAGWPGLSWRRVGCGYIAAWRDWR